MSVGYFLLLDLPVAAASDSEVKADRSIHSLLTASTSKLHSVNVLSAVFILSPALAHCECQQQL